MFSRLRDGKTLSLLSRKAGFRCFAKPSAYFFLYLRKINHEAHNYYYNLPSALPLMLNDHPLFQSVSWLLLNERTPVPR